MSEAAATAASERLNFPQRRRLTATTIERAARSLPPRSANRDRNRVASRRAFLKAAAGVSLPFLLPSRVWADPPSERLRFAAIGMGGQMRGYLVPELNKLDQQIVAMCDVDQRQLEGARTAKGLTTAKIYRDYRELLEQERDVDAVLIATPDHWHVPIIEAALTAGKHVYCEKPLAHSVAECRTLEALVQAHPQLATQTGNQGCSTEGFRRSFEVLRAGVLGAISEVHVWHPAHRWPNGVDRPAQSDPVPAGLDWEFWLGTAPARPYCNGIYHPSNWRGWYDFGGGSIADFCCHGFQLAYRALELGSPTRIVATGEGLGHESFATQCTITYEFPAKGSRGPVRLFFHSGENAGPPAEIARGPVGTTGCLIVGSEGTLSAGLWNTDCQVRLQGETAFRGADHPALATIEKSQPRIATEALKWDPKRVADGQRPKWSQVNNSHMFEWVLACAGDAKTYSPFAVGAQITELGMLGVLALRMQRPIDWDAAGCRAQGLPAADAILAPQPASDKYLPKPRG